MKFAINGITVDLVEAHDRNVIHLQKDGYEPESLAMWARLIEPDSVVLDIGAYTGLYSIIAAKCGARRVVALEPMPAQQWRLRVNAARNKVKVEILPVAASDREGAATLNYNRHVPLTTGASLEAGNEMHSEGIVVKCITIDSLGLDKVDAIKLDVERHEPCVIVGAMQTIRRHRPPMLIETLDGDMRERILHMLPDYEAATILDGRNTLFTPKRNPTCHRVQSQEQPT